MLKGRKVIIIDIGINGFSIANASKLCGWPIMGYIVDSNLPPFLIGLYTGRGDPKSFNEFLKQFCDEARELLANGVELEDDGPWIQFKLRVFVTDTAARCQISGTKSNTSKSGCHSCDQHSTKKYNNFFETKIGNLRTDESFSAREDMLHHHSVEKTALELLGVKMKTQLTLDGHMFDLGLGKFLAHAFFHNELYPDLMLSQSDHYSMCAEYEKYAGKQPSDFTRSPRSLILCSSWKATECRQFLLYRIISSTLFKDSLDIAQEMFEQFVSQFCDFFPNRGLGYNVHNLLRIVDDVKLYGTIDIFSAYKFENYIQLIGNQIHKPNHIIQQIFNRLHEIQYSKIKLTPRQYNHLYLKEGDNCVLNDFKTYVQVVALPTNSDSSQGSY